MLRMMSSYPKMQRVNRVSVTTPVPFDDSLEHRTIGLISTTTAFRRILSRKCTARTLRSIQSIASFSVMKPSRSFCSLDPTLEPESTGVSSGAHPMAVRAMRFHQRSGSTRRSLSWLGHDSVGHRVHVGRRCSHHLHTRSTRPQPPFSLRRVSRDTSRPPVELAVQQQQLLVGGDSVLFGLGADIVSLLGSDSIAVGSRTIVVARCESWHSSSFSSGCDRSSISAMPPRRKWTVKGN